jgi:hypothetical protein
MNMDTHEVRMMAAGVLWKINKDLFPLNRSISPTVAVDVITEALLVELQRFGVEIDEYQDV